jgi:sugar/nucleoside kinase (ribokinase family)
VTDRPARPSTDGFSEANRTPSAASRSKPKGSGRDSRQRRPPDYVVIGHICADILPDGTAVLGGTALYSALAAATLGWRTGILTRGRYGFNLNGLEIPPLTIGSERIQIVVQDAEWPTCFVNEYAPSGRRTQQITRWAGPIDLRGLPPSWHTARVIHLGPIAQEIDVRQATGLNPQFLGTTPQGWMRDWPRSTGGRVQPIHLRLPSELVSQLDGIVVNDEEFGFSRDMVEAVGKHGYGVVTLGENGAKAFTPKGVITEPAFHVPVVDLTGAGDVFSASFFYRIAEPSITPNQALRFAHAAAGLSLGGVGANHIPTRPEIRRLMQQVADNV